MALSQATDFMKRGGRIYGATLGKSDILFRPVAYLFILFIVLCGITHLFSIYTIWTPAYFTEGALKLMTALVSVATAVTLWPLLPKALAMPSSEQLKRSNDSLREEVNLRQGAERQLSQAMKQKITKFAPDLANFIKI